MGTVLVIAAWLIVVVTFAANIWLADPKSTGRSRLRHGVSLFLFMLAGFAIVALASAYYYGINTIGVPPSFNYTSMRSGLAVAFMFCLFVPVVPALQCAAGIEALHLGYKIHETVGLLLVGAVALAYMAVATTRATPSARFEEFLGMSPPPSVTSIEFDKSLHLLTGIRMGLKCTISQQDFEAVRRAPRGHTGLVVDPERVRLTWDAKTGRMQASYYMPGL